MSRKIASIVTIGLVPPCRHCRQPVAFQNNAVLLCTVASILADEQGESEVIKDLYGSEHLFPIPASPTCVKCAGQPKLIQYINSPPASWSSQAYRNLQGEVLRAAYDAIQYQAATAVNR